MAWPNIKKTPRIHRHTFRNTFDSPIYMHVDTYIFIYSQIHTYSPVFLYSTHIQRCTHVPSHTHTHTFTDLYTVARNHPHPHHTFIIISARTHIHTHTPVMSWTTEQIQSSRCCSALSGTPLSFFPLLLRKRGTYGGSANCILLLSFLRKMLPSQRAMGEAQDILGGEQP